MAPPERWGGVVTIAACKWSIPNRSRLSAWTRHSPLPVISICKEACLSHVSDHSLTSRVRYSHNLLLCKWVTNSIQPGSCGLGSRSQVRFNFDEINIRGMLASLYCINRLNPWQPYFWWASIIIGSPAQHRGLSCLSFCNPHKHKDWTSYMLISFHLEQSISWHK